jgi:chromosome segregation ATPase
VAAAALASTQPPPVDELKALHAELAASKSHLAATTAEIPTLKSHIESMNGANAARQEEEGRKQAVVEELRRIADSGRDELRRILLELASARGAKQGRRQGGTSRGVAPPMLVILFELLAMTPPYF